MSTARIIQPELLSKWGVRTGAETCIPDARALPLTWVAMGSALPDRGLPRGIVEVVSPHGLGGGTSLVLSAMSKLHDADTRAVCGWIDSEHTPLYAPGVAQAGVDLDRLVVVRPRAEEAWRIAIKMAASKIFPILAFNVDATCGRGRSTETYVRKLSLFAEEAGSAIVLLTDAYATHASWPVALRLELVHAGDSISMHVTKEKRGRIGIRKTMPKEDVHANSRRHTS